MTEIDAAIADLGLAVTDVWRAECRKKDAEIERLRKALTEVRNATAVPLPDPNAHSWRAFYDAACTRLTRCANAARRGLHAPEQSSPQSEDAAYTELEKYGAGVPRNRRR